ncbi:unnamed protein product [Amoebophrya sp. A120]|nr:unnamed protein product [Amoebophrya sp. A120]|eukprot:GSA120T00018790001.1
MFHPPRERNSSTEEIRPSKIYLRPRRGSTCSDTEALAEAHYEAAASRIKRCSLYFSPTRKSSRTSIDVDRLSSSWPDFFAAGARSSESGLEGVEPSNFAFLTNSRNTTSYRRPDADDENYDPTSCQEFLLEKKSNTTSTAATTSGPGDGTTMLATTAAQQGEVKVISDQNPVLSNSVIQEIPAPKNEEMVLSQVAGGSSTTPRVVLVPFDNKSDTRSGTTRAEVGVRQDETSSKQVETTIDGRGANNDTEQLDAATEEDKQNATTFRRSGLVKQVPRDQSYDIVTENNKKKINTKGMMTRDQTNLHSCVKRFLGMRFQRVYAAIHMTANELRRKLPPQVWTAIMSSSVAMEQWQRREQLRDSATQDQKDVNREKARGDPAGSKKSQNKIQTLDANYNTTQQVEVPATAPQDLQQMQQTAAALVQLQPPTFLAETHAMMSTLDRRDVLEEILLLQEELLLQDAQLYEKNNGGPQRGGGIGGGAGAGATLGAAGNKIKNDSTSSHQHQQQNAAGQNNLKHKNQQDHRVTTSQKVTSHGGTTGIATANATGALGSSAISSTPQHHFHQGASDAPMLHSIAGRLTQYTTTAGATTNTHPGGGNRSSRSKQATENYQFNKQGQHRGNSRNNGGNAVVVQTGGQQQNQNDLQHNVNASDLSRPSPSKQEKHQEQEAAGFSTSARTTGPSGGPPPPPPAPPRLPVPGAAPFDYVLESLYSNPGELMSNFHLPPGRTKGGYNSKNSTTVSRGCINRNKNNGKGDFWGGGPQQCAWRRVGRERGGARMHNSLDQVLGHRNFPGSMLPGGSEEDLQQRTAALDDVAGVGKMNIEEGINNDYLFSTSSSWPHSRGEHQVLDPVGSSKSSAATSDEYNGNKGAQQAVQFPPFDHLHNQNQEDFPQTHQHHDPPHFSQQKGGKGATGLFRRAHSNDVVENTSYGNRVNMYNGDNSWSSSSNYWGASVHASTSHKLDYQQQRPFQDQGSEHDRAAVSSYSNNHSAWDGGEGPRGPPGGGEPLSRYDDEHDCSHLVHKGVGKRGKGDHNMTINMAACNLHAGNIQDPASAKYSKFNTISKASARAGDGGSHFGASTFAGDVEGVLPFPSAPPPAGKKGPRLDKEHADKERQRREERRVIEELTSQCWQTGMNLGGDEEKGKNGMLDTSSNMMNIYNNPPGVVAGAKKGKNIHYGRGGLLHHNVFQNQNNSSGGTSSHNSQQLVRNNNSSSSTSSTFPHRSENGQPGRDVSHHQVTATTAGSSSADVGTNNINSYSNNYVGSSGMSSSSLNNHYLSDGAGGGRDTSKPDINSQIQISSAPGGPAGATPTMFIHQQEQQATPGKYSVGGASTIVSNASGQGHFQPVLSAPPAFGTSAGGSSAASGSVVGSLLFGGGGGGPAVQLQHQQHQAGSGSGSSVVAQVDHVGHQQMHQEQLIPLEQQANNTTGDPKVQPGAPLQQSQSMTTTDSQHHHVHDLARKIMGGNNDNYVQHVPPSSIHGETATTQHPSSLGARTHSGSGSWAGGMLGTASGQFNTAEMQQLGSSSGVIAVGGGHNTSSHNMNLITGGHLQQQQQQTQTPTAPGGSTNILGTTSTSSPSPLLLSMPTADYTTHAGSGCGNLSGNIFTTDQLHRSMNHGAPASANTSNLYPQTPLQQPNTTSHPSGAVAAAQHRVQSGAVSAHDVAGSTLMNYTGANNGLQTLVAQMFQQQNQQPLINTSGGAASNVGGGGPAVGPAALNVNHPPSGVHVQPTTTNTGAFHDLVGAEASNPANPAGVVTDSHQSTINLQQGLLGSSGAAVNPTTNNLFSDSLQIGGHPLVRQRHSEMHSGNSTSSTSGEIVLHSTVAGATAQPQHDRAHTFSSSGVVSSTSSINNVTLNQLQLQQNLNLQTPNACPPLLSTASLSGLSTGSATWSGVGGGGQPLLQLPGGGGHVGHQPQQQQQHQTTLGISCLSHLLQQQGHSVGGGSQQLPPSTNSSAVGGGGGLALLGGNSSHVIAPQQQQPAHSTASFATGTTNTQLLNHDPSSSPETLQRLIQENARKKQENDAMRQQLLVQQLLEENRKLHALMQQQVQQGSLGTGGQQQGQQLHQQGQLQLEGSTLPAANVGTMTTGNLGYNTNPVVGQVEEIAQSAAPAAQQLRRLADAGAAAAAAESHRQQSSSSSGEVFPATNAVRSMSMIPPVTSSSISDPFGDYMTMNRRGDINQSPTSSSDEDTGANNGENLSKSHGHNSPSQSYRRPAQRTLRSLTGYEYQ